MFMGFAASSLHYMVPGTDPMAYLEALFPRQELFRVAGYVSTALLAFAAWAAYLFVRHTCGDRVLATVAAGLYGTSVFAIARITQVDPAFLVLIIVPLAMLVLRRVGPGRLASSFLILGGLLSVLVLVSFLQEAAYALILVGTYGLYRGLRLRNWQPVAVFGAALVVAIVIGVPRLVTVLDEVRGLDRQGAFHLTCPCELLRWFNDGIFGRFPSEARAIGNAGMNLREGLQLHTSILAALLILTGALRYRGRLESVATMGFLLVLGLVLAPVLGDRAALAVVGLLLVVHLARAGLWPLRLAGEPEGSRPMAPQEDVAFHLSFVALTLAVVLLEPARWLFHRAFLGLDLTHSRFSLAGLLPVCTLVAVFLGEWLGPALDPLPARRRLVALAAAVPSAAAGLWLIDTLSTGPITRWLGLSSGALQKYFSFGDVVMPAEVMKVAWSLVLLAMLLGISWATRWRIAVKVEPDRYVLLRARPLGQEGWHAIQAICLLSLALVTILQGVAYAHFQLSGPQNRSFPVPFEHNNYFVAPVQALRPPTDDALQAIRHRLETHAYRTVLVADLATFPAVTPPMEPAYGAHLAQYWRLRLVEGYGAGVSGRLAGLPWPDGTRSLRGLSFASEADLPWPLLAVLNVKYALTVNEALYYNLGPDPGTPREARVEDLRIRENPVPAVPRQFFVDSVRPAPGRSGGKSKAPLAASELGEIVPADPIKESVVEGYPAPARFSTAGTITAVYHGGHIELRVDPAELPRFVVLNEMYHPRWRAFAGETELTIYPTNLVMRGLVAPPGVSRIVLRFVPFLLSPAALAFYGSGLALGWAAWWRFRQLERIP